jgi:hypothetical protein
LKVRSQPISLPERGKPDLLNRKAGCPTSPHIWGKWGSHLTVEDGKVDHCGTDLFNLIRTDGKWLIASIADTGRKDCPAR